VNELLQGLGSKFQIELAYMDTIKPFAERGLLQFYSTLPKKKKTNTIEGRDKVLERKVSDVITELKNEQQIAGVQVVVLDPNGNHLINVVEGHFGDLKKNIPMQSDALILGYSCTKAITATLAHLMVKDGYLSYDEPICERVWPSFCPTQEPPVGLLVASDLTEADLKERWGWKRTITLRHILTHTSGIWSALPSTMTIQSFVSCEDCVDAFGYNKNKPEETILPTSAPGSCIEYHVLSFGWLVAGALIGAYSKRHNLKSVGFFEIYSALLLPKLSQKTRESGFYPCGLIDVDDDVPVARTETDEMAAIKIGQVLRDAEAHGEKADISDNVEVHLILAAYQGKEFLLDQRTWNCQLALKANVPAVGGRFTAAGLASFYHDLASAKILDLETLKAATNETKIKKKNSIFLGGANITSGDADGISMGMGYQLIMFDKDKKTNIPSAFGHIGVGGSVGFHHKNSGMSVSIMMNKADGYGANRTRIVRAISDHFDW
jgi:CubicO group peptidase (beta-lactamase class C family)